MRLDCLRTLFLFVLFISSAAQADLAMQNPDARMSISLDGRWDIIVDPYENGFYNHRYEEHENGYFKNAKPATPSDLVEYDFARSPKLNVPSDWNTQDDKLFWYEGTIWYHRDFEILKKPDQRYFVHFGAVNYKAIVYLNGKKIDGHEGGFTAFQFDITPYLKSGTNSLVVKVDNRRERDQIPTINTDWWNYGGITRSVKVIEVPNAYIADYFVHLDKTNKEEIDVWVKILFSEKGGSEKGSSEKDGAEKYFSDKGSEATKVEVRIPELNIVQKISLNKYGEGTVSFAAKPQLWNPDSPKLYAVEVAYQQEVVRDKIGFRQIQTQGENILLNGKSIFLKGISLHEESPLRAGRAWSEDDARTLLRWAKELDCNFVRLAHYPHNEAIVKMADQMGIMVWSEIPVYWTVLFNNPAVYSKADDQLEEMIARDKNRAAIILWSLANETPNSSARLKFISQLAQRARTWDNTRLITAALDTQSDDKGTKVIDDPLSSLVDVIGVNSYCGWYSGTPASCASLKWASRYHKPVILSEFGADALQGNHGDKSQRWTEEYQADVYTNNLQMIDKMTFVRGMSPWILKDFRSPRRPLPGIQDYWNRKGLISDRGIKKKAWHTLHDYYVKKADD